jgi:cytochrome c2
VHIHRRQTAFMKKLLLIFFAASVLSSCTTNSRPKQTSFVTGNLKSNIISLFADSAYRLQTPKGAIIRIAAQSFGVSSNSKVELEIKEAYSLDDIVLAGLTTESNGRPLKSAGMIYINATANGKSVELVKPIKIAIPTAIYDDRMQLFRGELREDSSVNWVDPQPLDTGITAKNLAKGLALFKANCASCHKPAKDFTGPMLARCRAREPNPEWAYAFTNNVNQMLETDQYAKNMLKRYGSKMTRFNLQKEDIKAILDYCDNEALSDPFAIAEPLPGAAAPDSPVAKKPCGYDTVYYQKEDTSITIMPDNITSTPEPASTGTDTVQTKVENEPQPNTAKPAPLDFTDEGITEGMYDISINAFGWYNLDVFVNAYPNAAKVELNVQLQMQFETEMNVFLFCPGKKLLTAATKKNAKEFLFEEDGNGTIPLFLGDKAVILAFGSVADKMWYGTASFNIKTAQTIMIDIKETTEAELKSFIQHNNIGGIKIDLNKKEDFEIKEKPCDDMVIDSAVVKQ